MVGTGGGLSFPKLDDKPANPEPCTAHLIGSSRFAL